MASELDHELGSESDDDNFNPAPADESDNEAAGGSDPDTRNDQAAKARRHSSEGGNSPVDGPEPNGKGHRNAKGTGNAEDEDDIGSSAHDDDDEEDEDDDEEEAVTGRPRKRLRRDPRNQYLDVEAEVDEDEDEDNDEDDEGQEPFIADIHPDDVDELPVGHEKDDRRHRELDRQRDQALQMDAEKQAEILRERYGRSARPVGASSTASMPRRYMLPDVNAPSIWGVKCKPGKEREIVYSILKRMEERANSKSPIPIISAFERAAMPGYLYVEARKQADVFTALDGVSNVYPRTKVLLVPIKEMPDLLRVIKSKELTSNSYVRIKRGLYQGDLGQVDDTVASGLEVSVRLVPRLSYGNEENNKGPMVAGRINVADRKRKAGPNKAATRPPQRLFSEVEAKKKHAKNLINNSTPTKKIFTYFNETYVNGLLRKDYKLQHLQVENVDPRLEEVTMFTTGGEDGAETIDLAALATNLKNNTSNESYLPGDVVEVYDGEQQGVYGKAVAVRGDIVTLSVTEGELRGQSIEVPIKGLRKRFNEGDHVKVIGGSRYRDEVGMVVAIKDDTVTIVSDENMREITVFSKDLREASDAGSAGNWSRYKILDLVQLDPATVACVTKVDRETLRVIDQNGSVRSIMPSQVSNQLERRRNAVATDRNGSQIMNDDTVREIGGEGKKGAIIHIFRSFLFIYNREQAENSGVSVVRGTNVECVAAKGGRVSQATSGPDLTKMNPALQRNGANGTNGMAPPRSTGRDRALGQTVKIRRGPHKGLLGIVKDTTDTEARVELHTKAKIVTVSKDILGFKDPITGLTIDYSRLGGFRGRGGGQGGFAGPGASSRIPDGGRTPMGIAQGGRTPAWGMAAGSRTPAHGSSSVRTPAWQSNGASGGRTPAYAGGGGATVNPYADGSRTTYGGFAGGRTPAWDPSSRTSYGGSTNDPFSSARTPAHEPSSQTPAYQSDSYSSYHPSSSNAASNDPRNSRAAYDAPTPAAAPTPSANGGAYAPTPTAGGATPYGGEVETPYSGQPETPGWDAGDTDGGPRYATPSP